MGELNSEPTQAPRPAETELLFDLSPEEAPEEGEAAQAELPGIGFGDFLRMIIVLGAVIGLIYGFFWFLKKFTGTKAQEEDALNLIASRPLKGDAALHLVEVGTKVYFIGSSSGSVNLLAEIDDKETLDELRLRQSQSVPVNVGGFARFFRDKFGGAPSSESTHPDDEQPTSASDPASFLRDQRERLKDL